MITTNKTNSPSIATVFAISVFLLLVVYIFFSFIYYHLTDPLYVAPRSGTSIGVVHPVRALFNGLVHPVT